MTAALTFEEIVRGLMREYGVPRDMAERTARQQGVEANVLPEQRTTAQELPDILWPVRITIPWSILVSDNDKFTASMRGKSPCMIIRREYAKAKEKIAQIGKRATGGAMPASTPLSFVGQVFMPYARRADPTNFAKLVQDALEGVVYSRDSWLTSVLWLDAGKDVDAPRAEITIQPPGAP